MILDIHRHLAAKEWFSENFWNGFARVIQRVVMTTGRTLRLEAIHADILPMYFDTTGEKHLEQMNAAGIEKTAVFAFDTGLLTGEPQVPIEEQNRVIFDAAKNHPDRIIPFVHIDPRRPGALEFVKRSVEEWGARGLKLHPSAGFNPEESETLDLIESIADYGIPVITHTGPSIAPTSSRYCEPIYLDRMLLRFPEVNVIAAHMAYGYREQLCSLGWQRPNLYADISMSQGTARDDYARFARMIRDVVDAFGPEGVLFGTDSPYSWGILTEGDFVTATEELATKAPEDCRLTESEVEQLLGTNAERLLGI